MNKLLLFAGTTEGRELAEFLDRCQLPCIVCTATEYGEALIDAHTTHHKVLSERLDAEGMRKLMQREGITHVVDATHPYASLVSENIKGAAEICGVTYLRLLRGSTKEAAQQENTVFVDSVDEAVAFLNVRSGHIFAATGSKELAKYTQIENYEERVTARILSTKESMDIAAACGFRGKNLICMQGPFSREMNTAMLRDCHAAWMVTKESGKTGGFPEKAAAAADAGARLVVVGRPAAETGMDSMQMRRLLCELFDLKPARTISLIGIGMGSRENMTLEALETLSRADALAGAARMVDMPEAQTKPTFISYRPEEIKNWADDHPEYEHIALLLSGDTGFYSGAKKLEEAFAGDDIRICSGISSVVYLCGRLHTAWEDVRLVSIHGRKQNLISAVRENRKVFALVGKEEAFHECMRALLTYGLKDVTVHAGCALSYPDERILSGSPEELREAKTGDLTALLIENDRAVKYTTHGLEDEAFTRAKVPMTKAEVRSISLSKMQLTNDSIMYDVGAGTGSVSIEAALRAVDGHVYAIEKKQEAADLIRQNACKLGAANLTVIEGLAPEAMEGLPVPTHAFIGGSSGNLQQICAGLLEKNSNIRIVINAIALETVEEALQVMRTLPVTDQDVVCVSIGKSKTVGRYHMMMGQNPVYVISFTGCANGNKEGAEV